MSRTSTVQDSYHIGVHRVCRPSYYRLRYWRLRLLRLRDRTIPWQVRLFYYHHESETQLGALFTVGLALSHVLGIALQAIVDMIGCSATFPSDMVQASALFTPGLKFLARRISVPQGKLLYYEAQPAGEVMQLVEGYGRLCIGQQENRRLTVDLIAPGDVFGEEALLDVPERESAFEAVLNSQIDVVTREDLTAYVHEHPETLRSLIEHLAQRLLAQQHHMARLAFEPLEQRLAWLLLELAAASGTLNDQEPVIPVYHKDLAAVLNVWRETITVMLHRWSNDGLISQYAGRIVLKDVTRLQKMTDEAG